MCFYSVYKVYFMKVINRYLNALNLRCSIMNKFKSVMFITLFYIMYLLKIQEIGLLKGKITLKNKNNKSIHIIGLNSQNRIYTFIEIFIDDCYNLKNITGEIYVDLGANIGLFFLGLEYFGATPSYYIGIEPMKENLRILDENLSYLKNKDKIKILPYAVSKKVEKKNYSILIMVVPEMSHLYQVIIK